MQRSTASATSGKVGANDDSDRRGAVILETLLAIPVLLVIVMGIVQLSMVTSGMSHLQRAARDGADVAARMDSLPTSGAVPAEVTETVSAILQEHNADWTTIRIDHNDGPEPPYALQSGEDDLAAIPLPANTAVAITVCVPETSLAPNLLKTFCFDLEGRTVCQDTVRKR